MFTDSVAVPALRSSLTVTLVPTAAYLQALSMSVLTRRSSCSGSPLTCASGEMSVSMEVPRS